MQDLWHKRAVSASNHKKLDIIWQPHFRKYITNYECEYMNLKGNTHLSGSIHNFTKNGIKLLNKNAFLQLAPQEPHDLKWPSQKHFCHLFLAALSCLSDHNKRAPTGTI